MKNRIRRSPSQWQVLLKAQQESRLSVTDFCRQQGLDAKYFSKRKRAFQTKGATSTEGRFIKMKPTLSSSKVPDIGMVLHYKETRLQITRGVDACWIADLMKALS